VGNGNPSSHEADKASQRMVFNGLAESSSNPPISPVPLCSRDSNRVDLDQYHHHGGFQPAGPAPPPGGSGRRKCAGNGHLGHVVPGATTYNLWRATTSGGPYTLIAGNIGGVNLGYTDNNVTNLTTYYYVVTANGNGANSAIRRKSAPRRRPLSPV
jgi:hypothetical protein